MKKIIEVAKKFTSADLGTVEIMEFESIDKAVFAVLAYIPAEFEADFLDMIIG